MNDIFKVKMSQRLPRDKYKLIDIAKQNQVTFGAKCLKVYWPKSEIPCHVILATAYTKGFPRYFQRKKTKRKQKKTFRFQLCLF